MKKYVIRLNGKEYEVEVLSSQEVAHTPSVAPSAAPAPVAPVAAPSGASTPVTSPMTGLLLEIKASVGQQVNKGDVVAILEAMKIQSDIVAPVAGTVTQIVAAKGDSVDAGAAILHIA